MIVARPSRSLFPSGDASPEIREVACLQQRGAPAPISQRLDHRPQRDSVLRAVCDNDRVTRGNVTLDDHAKIGAQPPSSLKSRREMCITNSNAELVAGEPRLCYLQLCGPDPPALAHERGPEIDSLDSQILAEHRRVRVDSFTLVPVPVVFDGIGIDRLVRTAVHLAVRLIVASEVHSSERYRSIDYRDFPDSGSDFPPVPVDFAHLPNIYREQLHNATRLACDQ